MANQPANQVKIFNSDGSVELADQSEFQPMPEASALRSLGDTLLKFGRVATSATKALTDTAGANNIVSRGLDNVSDFISSGLSEEAIADEAIAAQRTKNAEGKGAMAEIGASLKNIQDNPIDTFAEALGSIVPPAVAMIASKGRINPATAGAAMGVAQGAGAVKGSIYAETKAEALNLGYSEQEAEQFAQDAQAYTGQNSDQIALGGALGYLAGKTGAETSSVLTGATKDKATDLLRSTLKGFGTEAATEGLQGGQEKVAANLALQRDGADVAIDRGVAGQAASEAIAGGLTGGVFGAADALAPVQEQEIAPPSPREQLRNTLLAQNPNGAITQAAATAAATGAADGAILGLPLYAGDPLVTFPDGTTMTRAEAQQRYTDEELAAFEARTGTKQQTQEVSDGSISTQQPATELAMPSGQEQRDTTETGAGNELSVSATTGMGDDAGTSQPVLRGDISAGTGTRTADKTTSDTAQLAEGDIIETGGVKFRKVGNGFERVQDDELDATNPASDLQVIRELPDELPASEPQSTLNNVQNTINDANSASTSTLEAEQPATIDDNANEAATSPLNELPEPTQAQKDAGNYKVGRIKVGGLDISVENPDQSTRSGVDRDGNAWESTMNGHYGYVKGVKARSPDKEHVDVNVKPSTPEDFSGDVFVINQKDPKTGNFDEPKVYIGYTSQAEAKNAYQMNYATGWQGFDSMTQLPMAKFKEMLNDEQAFMKPVKPTLREQIAERKQQSITQEETESLFGLPAKREKALKRIDEGRAWFGAQDKAKEFVRINGLSDTHELIKGSGMRWEVVPKQTNQFAQASNMVAEPSQQFNRYRDWIENGNTVSKGMIEQIKVDERLNDGEAQTLVEMAEKNDGPKTTENVSKNAQEPSKQAVSEDGPQSQVEPLSENDEVDNKADEPPQINSSEKTSNEQVSLTQDKDEEKKSNTKEDDNKPAQNTEDSGDELYYNLRNKRKAGITWNELEGLNDTLRASEVTKQKIYPKPDYEVLNKELNDPVITHIIKQVYDSISVKPTSRNPYTEDNIKLFIDAINEAMDGVMAWARDKDATLRWQAVASGNASSMTEQLKNAKLLMDVIYPNGWRANADKVRLLGGNKYLGTIQAGRDELRAALKAIKIGFPAKAESWQKSGYQVADKTGVLSIRKGSRYDNGQKVDVYSVLSNGQGFEFFDSEAKAQDFIDGKKQFLLLDKYSRIVSDHDTEESAKEAARQKVKRGNTAGVEIDDRGIKVEMAQREGIEHRLNGEDVSSDKIREVFGFRGINFGTWMKGGSPKLMAERQMHLNKMYDAFMDLAEIMNVPPKAISLNGMLGVAIGAQGKGGAAAHFYPGVNEINLTREYGAGSLGHEWAHALDHYFAVQGGLATASKAFLTEHSLYKRTYTSVENATLRQEIKEKFAAIVKAMNEKTYIKTPEEFAKDAKDNLGYIQGRIDSWLRAIKRDFIANKVDEAEFDKLALRIRDGDVGDGKVRIQNAGRFGINAISDVIDQLRGLYKKANGRTYSIDNIKGLQSNVDSYLYAKEKMNETHLPQQVTAESDYTKSAAELDKVSKKTYWNTNLEKFARAFDAYLSDKLEEKRARNDYLSHTGRSGPTVPAGEERASINEAFDALIGEIKTKETDDGNVALFSNSKSTQQEYETRIDDLFNGGKANREGVKVLDNSDVLDMLGYGNLPVILAEGKVIAGQSNHHLTAKHWKKIPEWLENPAAVFDSETVPGSLVFIAPELLNGVPIVITIVPNEKQGKLDVHIVSNAYDKDSGKVPVARWVSDGYLRYIDKEKSRELIATSRLQLPRVLQQARGQGRKILVDADLVKYRANAAMRETVAGGLPLFSKGASGVGLLVYDIKEAIKNDIYGHDIDIYPTLMDVPIEIQMQALSERAYGVEGFYDNRRNRVALVAANIDSIERAVEVARHELIGHYGVENMLNDVDPQLLPRLLNTVNMARKAGSNPIINEIAQYVQETQTALALSPSDTPEQTKAKEKRIAKEIIAVMAERNIQNNIVKRVLDAIRRFLKKLGFIKSDVTDAQIASLLREAQGYLKNKSKLNTLQSQMGDVAVSYSNSEVENQDNLGDEELAQEVLTELANEDGFFRHPLSKSSSLTTVMREVYPQSEYVGDATREDEQSESTADKRHLFKNQNGKEFYVFEKGTEVWIDVSRFDEGESGGSVYAAIGNYAHNANKVFVGDPAGLSEAAMVRRTKHMLGLALRFGKTDFMKPSKEQLEGNRERGIEPLKWGYNDIENVRNLIHTFVSTTEKQFPQLAGYRYDFGTRRFVDGRGRPVGVDRAANGSRLEMARRARTGTATLRAFILTKSIIQSDSRQESAGILQAVLNGSRALVNNGGLDALFSNNPQSMVSDMVAKAALRSPVLDRVITAISEPSAKSFGLGSNIRTQLDKARQDPKGFGKMFDAAMRFETDARLIAARPAEMAPSIIAPSADTIKEAANQIRFGDTAMKDKEVVSALLFKGTLHGSSVLEGKVFTPGELSAQGITDKQIGMYFEARASVNASLDETAASVAYNMAREYMPFIKDDLRDNPANAKNIIRKALNDRYDAMKVRFKAKIDAGAASQADIVNDRAEIEKLHEMIDDVKAMFEHVDNLKRAGYMPLSRFGKYSVTAFNDDGSVAEFMRYETDAEAKIWQKELSKKYKRVERGVIPTNPSSLFAGADPETVALFIDKVREIDGVNVNDAVFQEWYRSAVSDRSALKRMLERKGTAGFDTDLEKVLASFLTSNARFAANNYNRGDMLDVLQFLQTDPAYKRKGDVYDEAKQLFDYVQNPADPFTVGRSLMFTWFMGGSIASAAVNMTQPLTMTLPWLYQYVSVTKAGKALKQASSLAGAISFRDKQPEGELGKALLRAREIGLVDPQETHHLYKLGSGGIINRLTLAKDLRTRLTGVATAWGFMFGKAEQYNRYLTFITAWNLAKENDLGDAFEFARRAVEETQGIYSKSNRPNWARGTGSLGAVGAAAFTFKQYSIAYVEMLARMARSGKQGRRAAMLQLGVLFLLAGAMGLPFADDEADILDTMIQFAGGEGNTRRHLREYAFDVLGEDLGMFALYGVTAMMPIDIQGRMGMGNLLPSTALLMPSNTENRGRSALEVFGASGSLVSDSLDAVQGLENGKDFIDVMRQFAPVAFKNVFKGADMLSDGYYSDTRGRRVIDTTESDAFWKSIGFQPISVSKAQKQVQGNQQSIARAKQRESAIADLFAKARFENDPDKSQKAREMLEEWNEAHPDLPIVITPRQVLNRVRAMAMTREERQMRATPRELRQTLLQ